VAIPCPIPSLILVCEKTGMLVHMRLLIVSSLIFAAAASRVGIHGHKRNQNTSTGTASSWSNWQLSFKGLSCLALEPVPFVGLSANWPKCWAKAAKDAEKIAVDGNCKLCDVDFTGSEAKQDGETTGCSAKVVCAGARVGKQACFEGHGALTVVSDLNDSPSHRTKYPDMSCLPCPSECSECHAISSKFVPRHLMSSTKQKFKCISHPVGRAETGGEQCVMPAGRCGACSRRTCAGWANFGCAKTDYRADCEFPTTFDNTAVTLRGPEDYSLTVKSGEDPKAMPPVLQYLTGEKKA